MLYSTATGELLAVMEARILTQIRTGAATGVATKYMARRNVHTVGVFGTGWQARTQLEAICAVRNIRKVKAYSIDLARQQKAFCREMTHLLGAEVIPVDSPKEVLKDSDIIVTATTSAKPVFDGELLGEGVHISAMGSGTLTRREVDEITVKKSDVIIVDSLENAKGECGDLMVPIEKGIINWGQVRELGDVVVGRVKGRQSEEDITLFECQGIGAWDISVALRIYELAKERGIGASVSF